MFVLVSSLGYTSPCPKKQTKPKQKYKIQDPRPNNEQEKKGGEGGQRKSSEKQGNLAKDFTNISRFQEGQSKSETVAKVFRTAE